MTIRDTKDFVYYLVKVLQSIRRIRNTDRMIFAFLCRLEALRIDPTMKLSRRMLVSSLLKVQGGLCFQLANLQDIKSWDTPNMLCRLVCKTAIKPQLSRSIRMLKRNLLLLDAYMIQEDPLLDITN